MQTVYIKTYNEKNTYEQQLAFLDIIRVHPNQSKETTTMCRSQLVATFHADHIRRFIHLNYRIRFLSLT